MTLEAVAPWAVLALTCIVTWMATPRRVTSPQFFDGRSGDGAHPGIWLVAVSAAITWIFAKSIANASDLAFADTIGRWHISSSRNTARSAPACSC